MYEWVYNAYNYWQFYYIYTIYFNCFRCKVAYFTQYGRLMVEKEVHTLLFSMKIEYRWKIEFIDVCTR